MPGDQPAIEIAVTLMADAVQQPDETPGPAAALIVVDDVVQLVMMTEAAEDMLQVLQIGQQPRSRRGGGDAARRQVHRAGNVCRSILLGTAEVDQAKTRRVQLRRER